MEKKKKEKGLGAFFAAVGRGFVNFFKIFIKGDWKTRLSYLIMGAGNILRGQWHRGIIFLAFEVLFIWYMINKGSYWIKMLKTLGEVGPGMQYDSFYDTYVYSYGDNSFKILLYGILTIFLCIAFVITYVVNVNAAYQAQLLKEKGKKLNNIIDDIRSLVDEKFYMTLLFLPVIGITVFTVMPIVFMIFVAFTNYDGTHDGYVSALFTWVGLINFKTMFTNTGGDYLKAFTSILGWTVVWAFFATFSNYFLGILLAMMINRRGIKFKGMWRTLFVMTIAVPQFISLLYVSKMFSDSGIVNGYIVNAYNWMQAQAADGDAFSGFWNAIFSFLTNNLHWAGKIPFWTDKNWARFMVILINIWVGVPYLMLIATGILMNIPSDLYESARIDGASKVQQFIYITMPYMLFVTGPYLLTSFTGNMNNFNVIYLLSSGGPANTEVSATSGSVGYTDLLITWLFKITQGTEASYYMASVIGIAVFIIVSVITLIVYGLLPSIRNEGDMN